MSGNRNVAALDKALMNRATRWILVGFCALPFMTTVKLPPLANFWGEFLAALFAVALLAVLNWRRRHASGASTNLLPLAALPFVGLALLMTLQHAVLPLLFPAAFLLPIAELLIAAALATAGAVVVRDGNGFRRAMDAVSLGLLVALVVNALVVPLEFYNLQMYLFQIVPRDLPGRPVGLVGQPNALAALAVLAWAGVYYRWLSNSMGAKAYWLCTVMVCGIVTLSASRAGVLCWVAVMFFSLLTVGRVVRADVTNLNMSAAVNSTSPRSMVWRTAALLMVAQLAWMFLPRFTGGVPVTAARSTMEPRFQLWADGFEIWLKHPWIGTGFDQFSPIRLQELTTAMIEPNVNNAHNLVIHLLAEFGLVGLLVCLVPLAIIVITTVRRLRQPDAPVELFLATALTLIFLTYSLTEFPLWYTYFLFPFAFLLGCLPQGVVRYRASKNIGAIRTGVWTAVAAAACVVAVDYWRLQEVYTDVGRQREAGKASGAQWLDIPTDAETIARASFFPLAADYMYARTMEFDGLLMDRKRETAKRVMLGIAKGETIARYVAFSLAEGDLAEADRWLIMASTRNVKLFEEAVNILHVYARTQPAVGKYLDDNGLR